MMIEMMDETERTKTVQIGQRVYLAPSDVVDALKASESDGHTLRAQVATLEATVERLRGLCRRVGKALRRLDEDGDCPTEISGDDINAMCEAAQGEGGK